MYSLHSTPSPALLGFQSPPVALTIGRQLGVNEVPQQQSSCKNFGPDKHPQNVSETILYKQVKRDPSCVHMTFPINRKGIGRLICSNPTSAS